MAGGVSRVILRCEDAMETAKLDLSECQLVQVPEAVYHLMRHTELKACNLSSNVITKIPPKFAVKFSLITVLDLSHNQMSKLPDELVDLAELEKLNISHNAFIALPLVAYKMPKLAILDSSHNHIVDVDADRLASSPALREVDLRHNPLTRISLIRLTAPNVTSSLCVLTTEREPEEWEDLTV